MIRSTTLAALALAAFTIPASAGELRVETRTVSRVAGTDRLRIEVRATWKNAWRNERNHDAIWLVVKVRDEPGESWSHAGMRTVTVTSGTPQASCVVPEDGVGAFCAPAPPWRGNVAWDLTLEVSGVDPDIGVPAPADVLTFGVEMVHIPDGPFTVGDPDPASVEDYAFYRAGPDGAHAGTLRVTTEAEIAVGSREGALHYRTGQYAGDGTGPIPAAFPKGTRAFYLMKYEILQGQYAAFLNTLSENATSFRSPTGGRGYYEQRGSIRLVEDRYVAGHPDRPANRVSWDDGSAFADWAGLRPYTELEFTKAARGPVEPIARDFPWGTASKERLLRRNQPDDDLAARGDADEARLSDATRDVLGASYYWVMDLAGSVWEKVVSAGHPAGRAFRGTHGDGVLGGYGLATNDDWPRGDHSGGGYGYRGGGYYQRGMRETDLNPHSRVAQRPYGAWGGGPRGVGYGFRAARTAPR